MQQAKIVGYALVALLVGVFGYYITALTVGFLVGLFLAISGAAGGNFSLDFGSRKFAAIMEVVAYMGGVSTAWFVVGRRGWVWWRESRTNSNAGSHIAEGT